jgi:hypothetical protein
MKQLRHVEKSIPRVMKALLHNGPGNYITSRKKGLPEHIRVSIDGRTRGGQSELHLAFEDVSARIEYDESELLISCSEQSIISLVSLLPESTQFY